MAARNDEDEPMEYMDAAIRELQDKVAAGQVDPLVAEEMIASIRRTHERLIKLEAQLGSRTSEPKQT